MSAFGDFFKTSAGQQAIGGGINSALGLGTSLVATNQQKQLLKQQAQIEADKAKNQLAIAQLQLEASRAQAQNAGATSSGNSMLYVGLGVGAVVILGIVIFAVTRKKAE
jgi:hypothetical protein